MKRKIEWCVGLAFAFVLCISQFETSSSPPVNPPGIRHFEFSIGARDDLQLLVRFSTSDCNIRCGRHFSLELA